ncbi:MAG: SCO family protein [Phycisphaerales bacterium]|nr:SCO family protein [Phycisphaerales bacterium]
MIRRASILVFGAAFLTLGVCLTSAHAQSSQAPYAPGEAPIVADGVAPEMEGVDITEHLGGSVPLDLALMNDDGTQTTMGALLAAGRPVMLHLGYYKCPMLCTLVLNEGIRSLAKVDLSMGKDFDLVSISISPKEGHELAHAKKQGYLAEYSRPGAEKGMRFLTAVPTAVGETAPGAIADAVGFGYKLLPSGEYSHAAIFVMLAPDGRIVRYLYGVRFDPATMRMAIVEAGEGKIGTPLDRFILWCHQWDPLSKGYSLLAFRVMQVGGAITVCVMAVGLVWMFARSARRARLAPHAA